MYFQSWEWFTELSIIEKIKDFEQREISEITMQCAIEKNKALAKG
jgi:hypothetical protein